MNDNILFTPFQLKSLTLKNRIGVAPMTRMSSPGDSIPRQDVLDFLIRRAKNGAAIVYTEAIITDYESAQGYPGQARLLTQRQIDAWQPVVKAIRNQGSVAIMQMFHCGQIYDRASAEDALKSADIALSGKSILLNPHWVE
ncbi:MAG: hypothetical protein HQ552_03255, partial [Desulfobacteraceae bacterium]|nr:hypothetical protein [Desulfobacteraceae bacterium]